MSDESGGANNPTGLCEVCEARKTRAYILHGFLDGDGLAALCRVCSQCARYEKACGGWPTVSLARVEKIRSLINKPWLEWPDWMQALDAGMSLAEYQKQCADDERDQIAGVGIFA